MERRRYVRKYVPIIATVYCSDFRAGVTCLVHNISIGGAFLVSAPKLAVGSECRVAFAPIHARPVNVEARVLRCGEYSDRSPWLAVEFFGCSPAELDVFAEMVNRAVPEGRKPAVVIVDRELERLRQVADEVEMLERQPLLASTHNQGMSWIGSDSDRIVLALVGLELEQGSGRELLDWLGQDYPGLHRAVLNGPPAVESLDRLLKRVATEPAPPIPWNL